MTTLTIEPEAAKTMLETMAKSDDEHDPEYVADLAQAWVQEQELVIEVVDEQ